VTAAGWPELAPEVKRLPRGELLRMLQIAKANQRECYSGLAAAFGYIERIEPQEDPDIDVVVLREKTRRAVRKAMRAIGVKFQRVRRAKR